MQPDSIWRKTTESVKAQSSRAMRASFKPNAKRTRRTRPREEFRARARERRATDAKSERGSRANDQRARAEPSKRDFAAGCRARFEMSTHRVRTRGLRIVWKWSWSFGRNSAPFGLPQKGIRHHERAEEIGQKFANLRLYILSNKELRETSPKTVNPLPYSPPTCPGFPPFPTAYIRKALCVSRVRAHQCVSLRQC